MSQTDKPQTPGRVGNPPPVSSFKEVAMTAPKRPTSFLRLNRKMQGLVLGLLALGVFVWGAASEQAAHAWDTGGAPCYSNTANCGPLSYGTACGSCPFATYNANTGPYGAGVNGNCNSVFRCFRSVSNTAGPFQCTNTTTVCSESGGGGNCTDCTNSTTSNGVPGAYGLTCASPDGTAPSVSVNASTPAGNTNWYRSGSVIKIDVSDSESGLTYCAIKLASSLSFASAGTWNVANSGSNGDFGTACSNPLQYTLPNTAGENKISAGAYDKAKNVGIGGSPFSFYVDNSIPTYSLSNSGSPSTVTLLAGLDSTYVSYDTWAGGATGITKMKSECMAAGNDTSQCVFDGAIGNQTRTLKITGSDPHSGLASYWMAWNDNTPVTLSATTTPPWMTTSYEFSLLPPSSVTTSATLYFGVKDRVGYPDTNNGTNSGSWVVKFDYVHPLITHLRNDPANTCANDVVGDLYLTNPDTKYWAKGACTIVLQAADATSGFPSTSGVATWALKVNEGSGDTPCTNAEPSTYTYFMFPPEQAGNNPYVGGNAVECTSKNSCKIKLNITESDSATHAYCLKVQDASGLVSNFYKFRVGVDKAGPTYELATPCTTKYSFYDYSNFRTYEAPNCWYSNPNATVSVTAKDPHLKTVACQFGSQPTLGPLSDPDPNPAIESLTVTPAVGTSTSSSGIALYCKGRDTLGWETTKPTNPAVVTEVDKYYVDKGVPVKAGYTGVGPIFAPNSFAGASLKSYWTSSEIVEMSAAYSTTNPPISPPTRWVYFYKKLGDTWSSNPSGSGETCPLSAGTDTRPAANGTNGFTRVDIDNTEVAQSTKKFNTPSLTQGCTMFCLQARNSVHQGDDRWAWTENPIATYVCRDNSAPLPPGKPYVQNASTVALSSTGTRYITKDQATNLPTWIWTDTTDYYTGTVTGSGVEKYIVKITSSAASGLTAPTITDEASGTSICGWDHSTESASTPMYTVICNVPTSYGAGIATCDAAHRCSYKLPVRFAWKLNPSPITTAPSSDYTYTVSVAAIDRAGNLSGSVAGQDVNVDISPPANTALTPTLSDNCKCNAASDHCYSRNTQETVTVAASDGFSTSNAPQTVGLRAIFSKVKLAPDGDGRLDTACATMKKTTAGAVPGNDGSVGTTPTIDLTATTTQSSDWYLLESGGVAAARSFSINLALGDNVYYVYAKDAGGNCILAATPGSNGLTMTRDDTVPTPAMSLWATSATIGNCGDAGSARTTSTSINVAMCTNDVSPRDAYYLTNNWVHNFDFKTTLWTESEDTATNAYYWGQNNSGSYGKVTRRFAGISCDGILPAQGCHVMELSPGTNSGAEPKLLYQRFAGGDQAIDGLTSGASSIYSLAYDASIQYKLQDPNQPGTLTTAPARWKLVFDYYCLKAISGNGYSFKVMNDGGSDVLCGATGVQCPNATPSLRNFTCGKSTDWQRLESDFFTWNGTTTIPVNPVFMAGINTGMNGDAEAKIYLRNVQLYRHPDALDATSGVWTSFTPTEDSWQKGTKNGWVLPNGDGKKRVYLVVKDVFNRSSAETYAAMIQDDIILDRRGPQFKLDNMSNPKANSLVVTGDVLVDPSGNAPYATFITTATPSISTTLKDDWTPLQATFTKDSETAGTTWVGAPTSVLPSGLIADGDGRKLLRVWYKDGGGNVSGPASAVVVLDTKAPVITASLNLGTTIKNFNGTNYTNADSVSLTMKLMDDWMFVSTRDANGYPTGTNTLKYCIRKTGENAPTTTSDPCWTDITPNVDNPSITYILKSATVSTNDGPIVLSIFGQDAGGHITDAASAFKITFTYDTRGPYCSDATGVTTTLVGYDALGAKAVQIDGAPTFTAKNYVDVRLDPFEDVSGSGVKTYALRTTLANGSYTTWTSGAYTAESTPPVWCKYGGCYTKTSFTIYMPGGATLDSKTVLVDSQFTDKLDIGGAICSASVIFDTKPPTGTI